MATGPNRSLLKTGLASAGVLAAVLAIGGYWSGYWGGESRPGPHSGHAGSVQTSDDPPPVSPSGFRNARRDVAYVGTGRCASCHPHEHESYRRTAHSLALADLDVALEPEDGEFEDRLSQRTYRIHRDGKTMRHEESIRTAAGEKLVLADLPIKYVVGSGRFSRTYLVEREGVLYESPATWYAARPGWGISPGFQHFNPGFQRAMELRCLWCHVGRLDYVEDGPQRVAFHSQAIDCERCHGAGGLHVEKHKAGGKALEPNAESNSEYDDTIVNPARLDRQRREDICAQCHYHGAATVEIRGRNVLDYRPGQRLSDYQLHYSLRTPGQVMEVVGHAEQMHLSRCYQSSDSLTCTTCHPPHDRPPTEERVSFYRGKCLTCHTDQACGLPLAKRLAADAADNCITCHMPQSPTEIPHFAFNHHRIGIHAEKPGGSSGGSAAATAGEPGELILADKVAGLSNYDQQRNLGLAYMRFSNAAGQDEHGPVYRNRALEILEGIDYWQHDDFEVRAGLSELYWGVAPGRTIEEARAVVSAAGATPEAAATACFTLASTLYKIERPDESRQWLERAVKSRPSADVWMMLSDCRLQTGDLSGSVEAARKAAQTAPDRPRYVSRLIELLAETKRANAAARQTDSHSASESDLDAEISELQKRVPILRDYRARIDQTPRPDQ